MAIFRCKGVNLVNGVIFGVEGGIRDKRNFDISEFKLHGTECGSPDTVFIPIGAPLLPLLGSTQCNSINLAIISKE